MNKQELASKIWESANKMRSKIEANEYKDYILGFIFYKYLSDKELKYLKENGFVEENIKSLTEENHDIVEYLQSNIGYFIAYKDLFSTWLEIGKKFDVSNVRDALSAFNRLVSNSYKKLFDGIFDTLQTGLSKLGDSSGAQTKAINGLLQLIKDIPMDGKQDYDVLGFIYEYLISMFAANAGKKAGEFYTPHEVSLLMSEIVANYLKGKNEIEIYDPTSGSGSLLINIGQSMSKYIDNKDNIKYYAQELKENTYNLTRMNLIMRGIKPDNIMTRNGDTLEEDWPIEIENPYETLRVDAVVSNPPYSQPWDTLNKENDPRYASFGLAPKGKADYAFLLHDLFHVKPDGIMAIVLPHGVLFRGGEEGVIRKNLIESNYIDTIIGLPANIFFGTGIPTIIMVLKKNKENTDILIIDASKGFIKEGKNNRLKASNIKKIVDTVIKREDIEKYSKVVTREEIRANDYNLNIPRYVDSSENTENWDIYASMFGGIPINEIDNLEKYWTAFPNLRKVLFTNNSSYLNLAVGDIKSTIKNHPDIKTFKESFNSVFINFSNYLKLELLDKMESISITKEKSILSGKIFSCLKSIPLIDKYEAYQFLDDDWEKIAVDLEIIQTEGFEATKKVSPNMVIKKKDGKEQEIQEGWIGRIIPFELVQNTILINEKKSLEEKEIRLAEISSEYEEIIDSMTEEEKDTEVLNEANNGFILKEVTKKLNELKLEEENQEIVSFKEKLERVEKLQEEEKELKAKIKKETATLHILTKEIIEGLSDKQVCELLDKKWIESLITSLHRLPDIIIDELIKEIEKLQKKYETTYSDLEKQIAETKKLLCSMIGDLEGNEFDMKGLSEFKALLLGE
ncbi:type I restriction-modification system subunit M [Fusobacterium sp. THCT1E2]